MGAEAETVSFELSCRRWKENSRSFSQSVGE